MSDIEIKNVTGGASGAVLTTCGFQPLGTAPATFNFHKGSTVLRGGIGTTASFTFALGVYDFTISVKITPATATTKGSATGTWKSVKARVAEPTNAVEYPNAEEEGTFQAQAGLGPDDPPVEEESASSASA